MDYSKNLQNQMNSTPGFASSSPTLPHAPGSVFTPTTASPFQSPLSSSLDMPPPQPASIQTSSPPPPPVSSPQQEPTFPPPQLTPAQPEVSGPAPPTSKFSFPKWAKIAAASTLAISVVAFGTYLLGNQQAQNKTSSQTSVSDVSAQNALTSGSNVGSLHFNKAVTIDQGASLTATGTTTLRNQVNSTVAFSVQDAQGSGILTVNTVDKTINIGGPDNNVTLQIAGAVTITGGLTVDSLSAGNATIGNQGITLNTLVVCSVNGCIPNTKDAVSLQGENASFYTNATNITSGTISNARLSTNVALLDASQTFSGSNLLAGTTTQTGNYLFKPTTDSAAVFRIQNSAGTKNLLQVDSQNGFVGVGIVNPSTNPPGAQLSLGGSAGNDKLHLWEDTSQPNGAAGASGFGIVSAETRIYVPGAGANHLSYGTYINNVFTEKARFDQNGSLGIGPLPAAYTGGGQLIGARIYANTSVASNVGQIIQGASAQTADLFQLQDSNANNLFKVSATGAVTAQNNVNSTTAFQIQNAAGTSNLFVVDTTNNRVGIGTASPGGVLDVVSGSKSRLKVNGNGSTTLAQGAANSVISIGLGTDSYPAISLFDSGWTNRTYLQNNTNAALLSHNSYVDASGTYQRDLTTRSSLQLSLVDAIDGGTLDGASYFDFNAKAAGSGAITSWVNVMRLQGNGNVGIGLINPQAVLSLGSDAGTAASGIKFGSSGDTNLYRSAVNTLKTDNDLVVAGTTTLANTNLTGKLTVQSSGSNPTFGSRTTGDVRDRVQIRDNGQIQLGDGTNLLDTFLYRGGASLLQTDGNLLVKTTSNSTTAFQVQNAAGNNYIQVDTSGAILSLGNTSIASTIQIGNTTGAVAQTINIGNNATASSATTITIGSTIGASLHTIQAGSSGITAKTTSTTAFVLQKADGTGTILTADTSTTGGIITLGSASSTPVILVVGTKNDNTTDPTCTAGAIYYNSSAAAFRGCQDSPSGFTNLGNPAGSIVAFAGSSAPSGYLIADGSSVLRATYPTLFAIIGTTYGSADGTHFNLPDLRGRVAVGLNTSEVTRTDVSALGNNEGAVIGSRTPYHKATVVQPTISQPGITITDPGHSHSLSPTAANVPTNITSGNVVAGGQSGGPYSPSTASATTGITAALSGAPVASGGTVGPQTNVPADTPAYLTINYIIKY